MRRKIHDRPPLFQSRPRQASQTVQSASMRNPRGRRLDTLAFERKAQSVQLNFRNIEGVNDALLPNIGGTNLELSVRRLSLASCEQPEHVLERRPILIG